MYSHKNTQNIKWLNLEKAIKMETTHMMKYTSWKDPDFPKMQEFELSCQST